MVRTFCMGEGAIGTSCVVTAKPKGESNVYLSTACVKSDTVISIHFGRVRRENLGDAVVGGKVKSKSASAKARGRRKL